MHQPQLLRCFVQRSQRKQLLHTFTTVGSSNNNTYRYSTCILNRLQTVHQQHQQRVKSLSQSVSLPSFRLRSQQQRPLSILSQPPPQLCSSILPVASYHRNSKRPAFVRCYSNCTTISAGSSSSSNNIQSQQRIKRFYKHVNVVEVTDSSAGSATTATDSSKFVVPYPRPPPSQLWTTFATSTATVQQQETDHRKQQHMADDDDDDDTKIVNMTTTHDEQHHQQQHQLEQKWYTVTLDGKQLRTPSGKIVMIPSLHLAHLIASEWNLVTTHIIPNQMPIMTYVCTVLDHVHSHPDHYGQLCYQYVITDTLGYIAHPTQEPILYQQQLKSWLPIKHWIQSSFCPGSSSSSGNSNSNSNNSIDSSSSSSSRNTTTISPTNGFVLPSVLLPPQQFHHQQQQQQQPIPSTRTNVLTSSLGSSSLVQKIQYDPETLIMIQQFISSLDVWHLLALYIGCKECKSFWLSCALLITNSSSKQLSPSHTSTTATTATIFTPQQIHMAARIEEEMNITDWGFVEGQHDYDRYNSIIQLRSVALFVQSL